MRAYWGLGHVTSRRVAYRDGAAPYFVRPLRERGSIDKPLTFDVGLIQLSFMPVCSSNTCNVSVKLRRGFALSAFHSSSKGNRSYTSARATTMAPKETATYNGLCIMQELKRSEELMHDIKVDFEGYYRQGSGRTAVAVT